MKINLNGKTVELSNDDLKSALEEGKESIDLSVDGIILRTADEENEYKDNLKREGTSVGIEIGRKEVFKGLGIEADGAHKSTETAISALGAWKDSQINEALSKAKVEPNKLIEEKEKDIQTLKNNLSEWENKYNEVSTSFSGYKKQQTISNELSGLIPDNVVIPKSDMMSLLTQKIKTDINDNNVVVAIGDDGQVMKDSNLNPLPIKEVVGIFFENNPSYLKPVEGGAGAGDSSGKDGKQSVDAFTKEMQEAGHAVNGEKFNEILQERVKAGLLDI